jgi:DNA-binding CsgD family transcriptional regulator
VPISNERLSHLIGLIYSCSIAPDRWEPTLLTICSDLGFGHAVLGLYRQPVGAPYSTLLRIAAGLEESWLAQQAGFGPDMVAYWGGNERLQQFPLGEPNQGSIAATVTDHTNNRFVREWLAPQGIIDLVGSTLVRNQDHLGSIVFARHESAGAVGEIELDTVRLLGPHFRRAFEINILFDIKTMETSTFEATLETLSAGIVLVADDCRLVYANSAAQAMLDVGDPIHLDHGVLQLSSAAASAALSDTVSRAAQDLLLVGQRGMGIPTLRKDGRPSVAHVLPLKHGDVRPGLVFRAAVAAVVIAPKALPPQMPAAALALLYDLTPAEIRVIELVVEGKQPSEISVHLGISINTVKTHLGRVFEKTGASRQADLARLVGSLALPV